MIQQVEVKIVTASNKDEVKQFANLAIKNRLYVPNPEWQLGHYLSFVRDCDHDAEISLAYIEDEPVGVALLMYKVIPVPITKTSNQIAVFVKKKFRRLGIGTKLVNTLTDKQDDVFARAGKVNVSEKFFEKNNIFIAEW
jgi:GNAT superfamily N-acetyltransferase